MRFYLNSVSSANRVYPLVNGNITTTFDETLDSGNFKLKANSTKEPYLPMTLFLLTDDNNNVLDTYYIVLDKVELFSTKPLAYSHTITIAQNTRKLSKHIVRNSVFTQPINEVKRGYYAINNEWNGYYFKAPDNLSNIENAWNETIVIRNTDKINGDLNFKVSIYGMYETNSHPLLYNITHISDLGSVNISTYYDLVNTTIYTSESQFPSAQSNVGKSVILLASSNYYIYMAERIGTIYRWTQMGTTTNNVFKYNDHYYKFVPINSNDYGFIPYEETPIQIELIKDGNRTGVITTITENMFNKDLTSKPIADYIRTNGAGTYYLKLVNTGNIFLTDLTSTSTKYNNSFDFVLQIDYSLPTYNYDAYDLLELLLNRQKLEVASYKDKGKQALFTLPTAQSNPSFYNLLKGTIPPNFTFTGETFFECVSDIFKLWDSTFTIDNNGVLGIEYLNEYGTDISSSKFTGFSSSQNEDKYNQALINFYQDALSKEIFPNKNGYCSPRSNGLGVPASTNDFCILLPHNIHTLNRVKCYHPDFSIRYMVGTTTKTESVNYDTNVAIDGLDITYFILEASLYGVLNGKTDASDSSLGNMYRKQNNCLYYAKGSNKIEIGLTYEEGAIKQTGYTFSAVLVGSLKRFLGLRFTPSVSNDPISVSSAGTSYTSNFTNIKINVDYISTTSGSLKVEGITNKYDGEMIVGQVNGSVDLNKLGLNMLGLSLKLGEPTLTMTHKISSWADRIRKGQYIVINGEKWVANICNYTFMNNNVIQGTIEFVKNFNALSQFVKVNQEKRLSVIDNSLTVKSEAYYIDYLYFSSVAFTESSQIACYSYDILKELTAKTFGYNSTYHIDISTINCYNKNGNFLHYTDTDGTYRNIINIYIPMTKYGAGNSLCFELSMDNPKNAGNRTFTVDDTWWIFKTGVKYFTTIVPYTDENGYADLVDFNILGTLTNTDFSTDFPIAPTSSTEIISIPQMRVYKQPNEILALNYEIVMLPKESRKGIDFIGSALIKNHCAVNDQPISQTFYLYYSTTDTYDILDTKAVGTSTPITSVQVNATNIRFNFSDIYLAVKSWAIADGEGNIYFASNTDLPDTNYVSIYLLSRKTRL